MQQTPFQHRLFWHKTVQLPWESPAEATPFHTWNEGRSSSEKGSSDGIMPHHLWSNQKTLQSISLHSDTVIEQTEGGIAVKKAQQWQGQTDLRRVSFFEFGFSGLLEEHVRSGEPGFWFSTWSRNDKKKEALLLLPLQWSPHIQQWLQPLPEPHSSLQDQK